MSFVKKKTETKLMFIRIVNYDDDFFLSKRYFLVNSIVLWETLQHDFFIFIIYYEVVTFTRNENVITRLRLKGKHFFYRHFKMRA